MQNTISVIDLFAGPGGLGEGFSRFFGQQGTSFKIKLSIEKDSNAHQTLTLRSFFRQFQTPEDVPECYYEFLRSGKNSLLDFEREFLPAKYHEAWDAAKEEAWKHTLGSNMPLVHNRIREALQGQDDWVLIGGPPCQAYSIAGRGRRGKEIDPEDDRVTLYRHYLEIIAHHAPPVFVMENVRGLLSAKVNGKSILEQILQDLRRPHAALQNQPGLHPLSKDYHIFSFVKPGIFKIDSTEPEYANEDYLIESEKFGIPQARHRIILLGIRKDFQPRSVKHLLAGTEQVNVEDVLKGLPILRSGLSRGRDSVSKWKSEINELITSDLKSQLIAKCANGTKVWETVRYFANAIQSQGNYPDGRGGEFVPGKFEIGSQEGARISLRDWYLDKRLGGVCNHFAREHMKTDLWRYLFSACYSAVNEDSPKLRHYPEMLLPNHKNKNTTKFPDRFRTQLFIRPSTTITSHISRDGHYYIHPDPGQCRSLTVREAARLQTFPDNYYFLGNRTAQYVQVGNAVPPLLAYQLAVVVADIFKQSAQKQSKQKKRITPTSLRQEVTV